MPWSVTHHSDHPYVEGAFTGTTSWQDIQALTARCIDLQQEHGITKFLIDTADMRPTASLADVFQLPASEYASRKVDRQTKIAVVYSPDGESRQIVTFYEMACTNRGWQAKSFTSRPEAAAWLAG